MLHDSLIRISKQPPHELHDEAYKTIPQWAIISNLQKGMFMKRVVNSLISLLGKPLHGELIKRALSRNVLQVCFQIDSSFNFPKNQKNQSNHQGRGRRRIYTFAEGGVLGLSSALYEMSVFWALDVSMAQCNVDLGR